MGIAPGSIFVIQCTSGCGPATPLTAPSLPLTTELGGTRVHVGSTDAYLLYSSERQIAAILPSNTPLGPASITVTYGGQQSPPLPVNVVAASFGIFAANGRGFGPGAVQNYVAPTSAPLNSLTSAANPGQLLILYGTGLGAVNAPDDVAPGAQPTYVPVEVLVADKAALPDYAGRSPGYPGLDQINFVLPDDAPDGCYVPIAVRVAGRISNTVTIAKKSGESVCDHSFGIPEPVLRKLDNHQPVRLGVFVLDHANLGQGISESVVGNFGEIEDTTDLYIKTASFATSRFFSPAVDFGPVGSCTVVTFDPRSQSLSPFPPASPPEIPEETYTFSRVFDAGRALGFSGPRGKHAAVSWIPLTGRNLYAASLMMTTGLGTAMPLLEPAQWTLSGPGGTDVGPFSVSVAVPDLPVWTNKVPAVDRSQPLTVNWSGGGSEDKLVIVGTSTAKIVNSEPPCTSAHPCSLTSAFACVARDGDGTFTIPPNVLSLLPATDSSTGGLILVAGLNGSGNAVGQSFIAPLRRPRQRSGPNVDYSFLAYRLIDGAHVRFQ